MVPSGHILCSSLKCVPGYLTCLSLDPALHTAPRIWLGRTHIVPWSESHRLSSEGQEKEKWPRAGAQLFNPLQGHERPGRASPLCGLEGDKFPSQGPGRKSGQPCPPGAQPQVLPSLCYGQKIIPSHDAQDRRRQKTE